VDVEVGAVLKIAVLYPELLGTYGDGGNGLVLAERPGAVARGLIGVGVHARRTSRGGHLPAGRRRRRTQRLASDLLAKEWLVERVSDGSYVVAVCAGLQFWVGRFGVEGNDEYRGSVWSTSSRAGERFVPSGSSAYEWANSYSWALRITAAARRWARAWRL